MAPQHPTDLTIAERAVGAAVGAAVKAAVEAGDSPQLWLPERAKADIDLARLAATSSMDIGRGFLITFNLPLASQLFVGKCSLIFRCRGTCE
jgi:hypothetical protein